MGSPIRIVDVDWPLRLETYEDDLLVIFRGLGIHLGGCTKHSGSGVPILGFRRTVREVAIGVAGPSGVDRNDT